MDTKWIRIIKASAGSGKTYTLARTFIAHLIGIPTGQKVMVGKKLEDKFKLRESNFFHRHMLAITFTNKATNEMKERIINELYKLGKGEGKYVDDFKLMFEYNDFNDVIHKARTALCDILFDYGAFNVSTIDSFFQGILRNFAREIDQDYNYNLELDEDYATSVAVHDFMLDLGGPHANQKVVDEWVKRYIETQYDNFKSWNFFGSSNSEALSKFAKIIFKEFFHEYYHDIIDYLNNKGNTNKLSFIQQFKEMVINYRNLNKNSFRQTLLEFRPFFEENNIPLIGLNRRTAIYRYCSDGFDPETVDAPTNAFRNYAEIDNALGDNILNNGYNDNLGLNQINGFKKIVKRAVDFYDIVPFLDGVLNSVWNLGMLGKINEKLEQYRLDTNSIMIADTNELISKVLESGAKFIYEHVGYSLHTYMIDEFQDTSHKQYENFIPLLEESISRGNKDLIIGDEKQSIYRFRNSDPSILRDKIQKRFDCELTTLDNNYRSLPAIVNFNNALFSSIIEDYKNETQYQSLIDTYNTIKQEVKRNERDGLVKINIAYTHGSDDNTRQLIIQALPYYINSLRKRGYNLSDIAILVNAKKEGHEIVENMLKFNDSLGSETHPDYINIVSAESLLLKNSPSVRLIMSVLKFVEISQYSYPDDDKDLGDDNLQLKHYIKKRIREQRLYKMLHDFETLTQKENSNDDFGEQLWQCFEKEHEEEILLNEEKDPEKRAKKRLEIYNSIVQDIMPDSHNQLTNLVNIVENIIEKYILQANKGNEKNIENAFILGFLNVVHNFSRQNNGGTVKEFLKYWESKKDNLAVNSASNANAVNVMTIHKAKGLEFKCVIIPFANWDLIHVDKRELFWIKRDDWMAKIASKGIVGNNKDIVPPLIPINYSTLKKSKLLEDAINEEEEKRVIDSMNKLYVALTRPKEELHIFSIVKCDGDNNDALQMELDSRKTSDEIKTVSGILSKYVNKGLENINFDMKEDFLDISNDGEEINTDSSQEEMDKKLRITSYTWGKEEQVDKKVEVMPQLMPNYHLTPLHMPVRISMEKTSSSVSKEGVRMHEIFRLANQYNDFNFAINYGIANGLFKGNKYWTVDKTRELIASIKENEQIMAWYDSNNVIYTERNISFPHNQDSSDHEHRRPDRIVRRPDGEIIVIDYKFGYMFDEDTIAKHKKQVGEYRQLLAQLGEHNVTCYLWYLRRNEVVEVE